MFLRLFHALLALRTDRKAVTAIEYALMAAMIAVAILGATQLLANKIGAEFNIIGNTI